MISKGKTVPIKLNQCPLFQLFVIGARISEPILVVDGADLKSPAIPKEIDHVNQPAVFPDRRVEVLTLPEGAGDLGGIAHAKHDLRRQFEIVEDLMPDRHQPYGARVFKTEIALAHSLLEKGCDFALYRRPDQYRLIAERAGAVPPK